MAALDVGAAGGVLPKFSAGLDLDFSQPPARAMTKAMQKMEYARFMQMSFQDLSSAPRRFLAFHQSRLANQERAPTSSFFKRVASFASSLPTEVMSRTPNPTPIFLRKALGGSPPAKIQT